MTSSEGWQVYLGGTSITNGPLFKLTDPVTGSFFRLSGDGSISEEDIPPAHVELAGLGTSIPLEQPPSYPEFEDFRNVGYPGDAEGGCTDEWGDPLPCTIALALAKRDEWFKLKDKQNPFDIGRKKDPWRLPDDFVGSDNKRQGYRGLHRIPYPSGFYDVETGESIDLGMWVIDPGRDRGERSNKGQDCNAILDNAKVATRNMISSRYDKNGKFVVLSSGEQGTITDPVKGLGDILTKENSYFREKAVSQAANTPETDTINLGDLMESARSYAGQLAGMYGNSEHQFEGLLDKDGKDGMPQKFYHNPDAMKNSLSEIFTTTIRAAADYIRCKRSPVV